MENGILVWKAPAAPKPEPMAELKYGDKTFLIPYTLMGLISGWVSIGGAGTYAPQDALENTKNAFRSLEIAMGADANPLTEEQKQFYARSGISVEPGYPFVKDYGV